VKGLTLAVDVGGTFTDIVWWDGARLHVGKTTSTADQSDGVVEGSRALTGGRRVRILIHGTTVATNALLERRGATVALVTDPGFEDLIEIARQDRPSLYDHDILRPEPLVPRSLRFGGVPDVPISADIVAVVLLDSYADPSAERAVAERLAVAVPGVDVVQSSRVTGEFREFERLSTTVLTAYLRPVVHRYLDNLERRVRETVADRLLVMQSSGGLVPAAHASDNAASILLSGPAGGVVAAAGLGSILGHGAVVSFDMGGTSTDVCRVEANSPDVSYERSIDGYVSRLPSVAVHTVGAGGGSVGWIDPGESLRVGPRSAGAQPGPASYGRGGTEATVTDADLVVGRLSAGVALADDLTLDERLAREALAAVGEAVGLTAIEAALGMVEIVESHMERAVRRVSVEEGFDPGDAALVAFGGAGGLHAVALASRLGMGSVVVPPQAGVFSALGLLLSPPRVDLARTILTDPSSTETLRLAASQLAAQAEIDFVGAVGSQPAAVDLVLDMRYVGQSHETSVEYHLSDDAEALIRRFHSAHHRRNGFSRPDDETQVVTVRASAVGLPALTISDLPSHAPSGVAEMAPRPVFSVEGPIEARVFRRAGLVPGTEMEGPAVVADDVATTWIPAGARARLHDSGALVIEHA
jgi:N-methylhydantoinase A